LKGDADLRSSESDAFGFMHGGLEAISELIQLFVGGVNEESRLAQDGVTVNADG